jgi:hypothetical protein
MVRSWYEMEKIIMIIYIYIYSEESELLNRENQSGVTPALGA